VTLSVPAPVNNQPLAARVAKGAGTLTINATGGGNGFWYNGALQTTVILGANPSYPFDLVGNTTLGYFA
jgi:hypothetical protein